ncbi:hypothetical protein DPSP01_004917 [Paraphaeosphaeria sporulosa]
MPRTTDNANEYMQALQLVLYDDPSTSTREVLKKYLLDVCMPGSFVHDDWVSPATTHQALEKLAYHPAMSPNLQ